MIKKPKILILIPFFGNLDLLIKCISSVTNAHSKYTNQITLINDGTIEDIGIIEKKFPGLKILNIGVNSGFTNAVNVGLNQIDKDFDFIVLLNSDMEVLDEWLDALVSRALSNPEVGIVGGMELSALNNDYIINAGGNKIFQNGHLTNFLHLIRKGRISKKKFLTAEPLEWVSFGIVLITKKCIDEVGKLDEQFLNYFSDVDYCKRASLKNYLVLFEPTSKVIHKQHKTAKLFYNRSLLKLQEDRERFYKKWYPKFSYYRLDEKLWNTKIKSRHASWIPKTVPHFDFLNFFSSNKLYNFLNLSPALLEEAHVINEKIEQRNVDKLSIDSVKNLYLKGLVYLVRNINEEEDVISSENLLILSPHYDDIALSISGLLLSRKSKNFNSHLAVFFGRSNYSSKNRAKFTDEEITYVRSIEETTFCAHLNLNYNFFNIQDRLLRYPQKSIYYESIKEIENQTLSLCLEHLNELISKFPNFLILCPLGSGLMSDHCILTYAVCNLISKKTIDPKNIIFYEDLPYASQPGAVSKGLTIPLRYGITLRPETYDVSKWFESKRELLSIYYSQIEDYHRECIDQYGYSLMKIEKGSNIEDWRRGERVWKIQSINGTNNI